MANRFLKETLLKEIALPGARSPASARNHDHSRSRVVLDLRGLHQIMDTLISPSLLDGGAKGLNRVIAALRTAFPDIHWGQLRKTAIVYDLSTGRHPVSERQSW